MSVVSHCRLEYLVLSASTAIFLNSLAVIDHDRTTRDSRGLHVATRNRSAGGVGARV